MKTGAYGKVLDKRLQRTYEEFLNDPDILNLTPELALLKLMLVNFIKGCDGDMLKDPDVVKTAAGLLEIVTRTVERMERIQSNHTLTMATMRLIMVKAIEAVRGKWVAVEDMPEFIKDWRIAAGLPGLLDDKIIDVDSEDME